ncbi:MAG TPA: alpha/beta fold hydrolase [Ohtaekwangia sp.]|uniref:alpha/beta fold hydrolase n=1 Tax=Ohtaekwangia sp. TaxID=2066019 RepID=UPI002F95A5AC
MSKKRIGWLLLIVFILINAIAFQHAYKFTHFSRETVARTKDPAELSVLDKMQLLFTGIDNPRPMQKEVPGAAFKTVKVISTEELECWKIGTRNSQGTVIMFHGYAGEKSSLIMRADEFRKLGYTTFLVDFMGSGGSGGNTTSIGYKEAEQVKDCFEYIHKEEKNVILFGTSMGAAAVLKAMDDYELPVTSVILECPFGSLYKTVQARFRLMHIPTFPMAGLLCFWGGLQNGYWAFLTQSLALCTSCEMPGTDIIRRRR